MTAPDNAKRKRGRPRSETAYRAIHAAFIAELNAVGYADVQMDRVAKRAQVSRTTIYRWYKGKEQIALEVAAEQAAAADFSQHSGDPRADVYDFLTRTFETARMQGPLFTALMARAQMDDEFADKVWESFSRIRRQQLAQVIAQPARNSRWAGRACSDDEPARTAG